MGLGHGVPSLGVPGPGVITVLDVEVLGRVKGKPRTILGGPMERVPQLVVEGLIMSGYRNRGLSRGQTLTNP
jgi:hypothetical protein